MEIKENQDRLWIDLDAVYFFKSAREYTDYNTKKHGGLKIELVNIKFKKFEYKVPGMKLKHLEDSGVVEWTKLTLINPMGKMYEHFKTKENIRMFEAEGIQIV